MNLPAVNAPLRWFNLHPWWRRGTVPVWGARLRSPTFDRWLALRLHQLRLMGVQDRRFFEAHVRPGMAVVDIGANQGLYTLLFARLVGKEGKVWAFEPDDLLYRALEENVGTDDHAATVRPCHAALGTNAGTMVLYRSLLNSGDNRMAAKAAGAGPREAVHVRVERLDEVLRGERIDFIKLDVQGWEAAVFAGMQGLLNDPRNAGLSIYFEFWPAGLRDAGSDPLQTLQFLADHGFSIYDPTGSAPELAVNDFPRFVGSLRAGAYTNLLARRAAYLG